MQNQTNLKKIDTLKYNNISKIVAIVSLFFSSALFIGLFLETLEPHMIYAQYLVRLVFSLYFAFSLYLVIDVFSTYCTYDNDKIIFYSLWNGKRELYWKNLQKIHFNQDMKYYILTFNEKNKIRLSLYLTKSAFIINHIYTLDIKPNRKS